MWIQETLRENLQFGSGGVRRYALPGSKIRITQISTFCPEDVGPGATHVYLIDSGALVLMDTGIPTRLVQTRLYSWFNRPVPPEIGVLPPDLSEKQLTEGLKLAGYSLRDIELLVISHGHWDHFLLGRPILDHGRAVVAAHVLETPHICNPWMSSAFWASRLQQLKGTGMPMANNPFFRLSSSDFGDSSEDLSLRVDLPILGGGELPLHSAVPGLRVMHLPGHTPGSIGLLIGPAGEEQALLSGDSVLNPITPNPDDLLAYLRSMEDLAGLRRVSLTLPAHGEAIWDLASRVRFLQAHHRHRLRLTYRACRKPSSVWDVATSSGYFDVDVDKNKINYLAASEALIHMEMLKMVEALQRVTVRDGVHYFQASEESFDGVYNRILDLVKDRATVPMMRY